MNILGFRYNKPSNNKSKNSFKDYSIISFNKFILPIVVLLSIDLNAYQSEDKLKVVLVGKVGKYITWQEKNSDDFIITILNNQNGDLFNKIYRDKKIKNHAVKLKYIQDIDELTQTNILYIPSSNSKNLEEIFKKTVDKNILTISDIRGFSQKGGILQIYFASQKPKIRINLDVAKRENLKIKSSLLRIADIVKDN